MAGTMGARRTAFDGTVATGLKIEGLHRDLALGHDGRRARRCQDRGDRRLRTALCTRGVPLGALRLRAAEQSEGTGKPSKSAPVCPIEPGSVVMLVMPKDMQHSCRQMFTDSEQTSSPSNLSNAQARRTSNAAFRRHWGRRICADALWRWPRTGCRLGQANDRSGAKSSMKEAVDLASSRSAGSLDFATARPTCARRLALV